VRSLVTVAVATALAASGCGTGRLEIDHKKAEDLAREIGAVKGSVKSASCPSGIKTKRGEDFDCRLTYADGVRRTITIHQLDDKGRIRTSASDVH
jgi:Domain of unknown function (DUF4333)